MWCKFRFQSGPQGLSAAGGFPRRCVSRARVPNTSFRGTHAKTEGLFSNRAAYRRVGHFDHLRHGNSQLSSFPPQLTNLGGANPCATATSAQACLIDDTLAQGTKSGYLFALTGDGAVPSFSFIITGTPQAIGSTGQLMYCTDQTGVIHFDLTGAGCTNASLVLQ